MFWDASFDQNNMINGKCYSEHIASIMGGKGPTVPTKPPVTFPPHKTTSRPVKTTKQPMKTTKRTNPTKPSKEYMF